MLMFDTIVKESIYTMAIISMPPVVACSVVGIAIAVVQSAMQLQEQSIQFLLKLIVVVSVMLIFGEWGGSILGRFFLKIIDFIPYVSSVLG